MGPPGSLRWGSSERKRGNGRQPVLLTGLLANLVPPGSCAVQWYFAPLLVDPTTIRPIGTISMRHARRLK